MPSKQKHRGQHGNDPDLFHPRNLAKLNEAVRDFSYLLTYHYPENGSLKLIGDRYRLTERQRKAVLRASCSEQSLTHRLTHAMTKEEIGGNRLAIDGYNLLITIESGLAGGIVLDCRDGCYRDIASVHGTYRSVDETRPALTLIGDFLKKLNPSGVIFYLDKPVSNSGRLRLMMEEISLEQGFNWEVWLVNNPDKEISEQTNVVAISSDSWVLDHSQRWYNLPKDILSDMEGVNIISLKGSPTFEP
ncbi:MAG: DUF434 domain-containing protein [Bacteroidia bacterium]|nr:DUF434 domain-containing protein [Bacteroidia bacterium]